MSQKWNKKNLFLFTMIFGLATGNHLIIIYSLPGFLIWYLLLIKSKKILFKITDFTVGLLGLGMGLLIYLFLPITEYLGAPNLLNYSILNPLIFFII